MSKDQSALSLFVAVEDETVPLQLKCILDLYMQNKNLCVGVSILDSLPLNWSVT